MAQPSPLLPVENAPGIYRRGTRYVVRWRHRGRQQQRSFRTLTEAKAFKAKAATGESAPTSAITLVSYAGKWLDEYTGRTSYGLRDSTRESYRDAINRVVVPYFKRTAPTLKLRDVKPKDLRAFIDHCAAMTVPYGEPDPETGSKLRRPIAAATVRRYFAPLRALLATAYEDGLIAANPAAGLRVIVPGERQRRVKRMSPEQTRALLAEIPTEHADMTYLMAATGLRIGETLALTWGDLGRDEDGRPVLTVRTSKTAAGERTIPLSPETLRRLTKRRAEVAVNGHDAPMFASAYGTPLEAHNFRQRVFKPAAKRAGVPWATPHSLRHGMASLIADRGYSPAKIAAHLGHADGGVLALRTYVKPEAIDSLTFVDEALSGATETV